MSELISGKDALIALANGEEVEYQAMDKNFYPLQDFLDSVKIRLKPKTIKLNGFEFPACARNMKSGERIWILESTDPREYCTIILDESDEIPAYFWKSEEEIKQVVAALRSIFKGEVK